MPFLEVGKLDFFINMRIKIILITYFPFFLGNFVIEGYSFFMPLQSEKKTNTIMKKVALLWH
jgi:hypothetical protein